jgi:mannobiose 2-epimerase
MKEMDDRTWASRFRDELTGNILSFWTTRAVDRQNGGFFGMIDGDLRVDNEVPRTSVVNTRILWTISAACRLIGSQYRETADWAYDYIRLKFWDSEKDGLYWTVDCRGNPLSTRKQIYAQAFGIYALAEYYRVTGIAESLALARCLIARIEEHSYDPIFKAIWKHATVNGGRSRTCG